MKAFLVLVGAALLCGLAVWLGPLAAEALLPVLGDAEPPDYPAIETLYSGVIFGALLLFALIGGALSGVNPLRLGRRSFLMLLAGIAIGLAGVAAAAGYTQVAGTLIEVESVPPTLMVFLWGSAMILFQTATEEIYFRGWLQPVLAKSWGMWPALFVTTLLFSLLHLLGGAQTVPAVLNIFLGGLLFGLLAYRSNGIAGAVGAHFGWNWLEQLVLGLTPNPGTGSFSALWDFDLTGAPEWGGSEEGLNASAAMTFALVALLVPLLVFWTHRKASIERVAAKK